MGCTDLLSCLSRARRRRCVGISSLQSQQSHTQAFSSLSSQISSSQIDNLKAQMDQFRSSLREFAVKHRDEIRKDPVFRMHFQVSSSLAAREPSLQASAPAGLESVKKTAAESVLICAFCRVADVLDPQH